MLNNQHHCQSFNVLLSQTHWNWPQAVADIFQPRGVNAMMASSADDIIKIAHTSTVHLAIVDSGMDELHGVRTVKVLRNYYQTLPCIMLADEGDNKVLAEALNLNVFSVLNKPVDIPLLEEQIDRLFRKFYESDLFSTRTPSHPPANDASPASQYHLRIRWLMNWWHK